MTEDEQDQDLGLSSCPNFRDIGGAATADGRRVRKGLLFRAGTLTHLGPDDHALLAPLGIKTICDLRHVSERELEPTNWHDREIEIMSWNYRSRVGRLIEALGREDATPEDSMAVMESFYGGLPLALSDAIRATFAAIAAGKLPLLFHCSAGKDRTGAVAGLILDVLGVPRATNIADYARSARLMDYEAILARHPGGSLGLARDGFSMTRLSRTLRAPLLASEPRYLAAMFTQIEAEAGSVEAYLTQAIRVPASDLAGIRANLLQ